MRRTIERILRKYGTSILLRRGDGDRTFYGFMQHTASLGWKNMQPVYSPIGEVPRGQYLLMMPLEPLLKKGDIVLLQTERGYLLHRVTRLKNGMLQTTGDYNCYRDEYVAVRCVLGRVVRFTRKGKRVS